MSNPIRKLQKKLQNKSAKKLNKGVPIVSRQLWTDNIFEVENPNHSKIKKDLTDYLHEYRSAVKEDIESNIAPKIKHGLFESKFNIFERFGSEEPVSPVVDFCHTSMEKVITAMNKRSWAAAVPKDTKIIFDIFDSWFHITKEGGYHEVHNHPGCSWCAIYYVDVGDSSEENGGLLRFYNPRWPAQQYEDMGTMYIRDGQIKTVVPTNGKLVIFPSYLYHSITPLNKSTKDRINFAMNMRVYEGIIQ